MEEDWDLEIAHPTKCMKNLNINDQRPSHNYTNGENRTLNPLGQTNGNNFVKRGRGRSSFLHDSKQQNGSGFSSQWRSDNNSSIGDGQGFGGRGRSRGFSPNSDSHISQNYNTSTMEVLNDSIGKLIGKAGSKIREIQNKSGARIKIDHDGASNTLTPLIITGSEQQIADAKQLVNDNTIVAGDIKSWAERENRAYGAQQMSVPKINWGELKKANEEYQQRKWQDLPEVIKNTYKEKKHIALMDPSEAAEIRKQKNNITCQVLCENEKRKIPNPVLTFEDAFEEYAEILETVYENKFTEPSPIQSQGWPVILSGMDCIGIAQTGTGKTLAFLLPAFIHIDLQPVPRNKRNGPSCLILSPTRELAQQIEKEVKKFHYKGIRSVCVYGGGDRTKQIREIQKGVEIVIGTPGRLNDLLMNNIFKVTTVTYLVLDEADRMLDMGFEPEIKKILIDIRPDRQTIMTSATWLPGVQRIADQYLHDPIRVNVGSMDLAACHSVKQMVEFIDTQDKQQRTLEFIYSMGPEDKLIIFVGRKITADDISSNFVLLNVDVGIQCIHGDRDQADREQALEDLKTGAARVLIATDVASRGLDVKDLTHVLNYDFPRHIEDYVHRIGRTGRAGRSGCALTFVTREDWMHVGKLIPIMEEAGQDIPSELVEMAERWEKQREERRSGYGGRGGGRGGGGGVGGGCFKCGKEGHFSRECPEGGGGGGRGGFRGGRGGSRGGGGRRDKRESGCRVLGYDAI